MTDQNLDQNCNGGDLLFAWLAPIENQVDKKLHRPRSPNLSSPLLRAKTAIRRTFSAGQRAQRHREQGALLLPCSRSAALARHTEPLNYWLLLCDVQCNSEPGRRMLAA
jgi:hypothetical protein